MEGTVVLWNLAKLNFERIVQDHACTNEIQIMSIVGVSYVLVGEYCICGVVQDGYLFLVWANAYQRI